MTHETETSTEAWLDDAGDEEAYQLEGVEVGSASLPVVEVDEHEAAQEFTLDGSTDG